MARQKIKKDTDLAAGFFTDNVDSEKYPEPKIDKALQKEAEIKAAKEGEGGIELKAGEETGIADVSVNKNLGGRPKKNGLKNEQFSLTMNPEKYEKLRIVACEQTRGNFSALIDDAIRVYCKSMNIDLSSIVVDDSIMEVYREKQARKSKRIKKE